MQVPTKHLKELARPAGFEPSTLVRRQTARRNSLKKHGRKRANHAAGVDWSKRKLDAIGPDEGKGAACGDRAQGQRIQANRVVELGSAISNDAKSRGYPGGKSFAA